MKESYIEINVKNLQHNFKWYQSQSLNKFQCPMIKANAYGVGLDLVFSALKSLKPSAYGVVRLSEALSIRKKDNDVKILMFNPCDQDDYNVLIDQNITPVISSFESALILEKALKNKRINQFEVHIEVDTGMNRLGFRIHELDQLFAFITNNSSIIISGVFSHFLKADDWPEKSGRCFAQLTMFEEVVKIFDTLNKNHSESISKKGLDFHLSSSKAFNDSGLSSEYNDRLKSFGLRPGLGLYGISQNNKNLKPVLSLKSPIVSLKWIPKGESVSYDGVWVADKKSLIGVLPIGYGDGYPRSLTGKTYVLIHGQKIPVVGLICMDFLMIDCTSVQDKVKIDDLAVVFGQESNRLSLSIEDLSDKAGMITYEFITGLSARLKRVAVETN